MDQEKQLDERDKRNPPCPPPIPPYTSEEKAEYDKAQAAIKAVIHGQSKDPKLIFEIINLTYRLPGSMRRLDLDRKIKHYMTLQQHAARQKLWADMYQIVYGLGIEVSNFRALREREGSGVQNNAPPKEG